MWTSARSLLLLGLCGAVLVFSSQASAECGGTAQCIGVGPSEAQANLAHHGNGPDTFTLAFGNQQVNTASTAQTVYVAAVTGPAGTTAVLGAITITGANAAEFSISGGSCLTSGPVHGGAACTITLTFNPASAGTKSATVNVPLNPPACDGCITGRAFSLSGTGTTPLPTATATSLTVAASTPATLDLANFIGGTGSLSVRIAAAPAHGTAVLSGTRVTYTPAAGYLGPDSFTYDVTDVGGTSAPAAVTISVVPRADPTADPAVIGTLRAQAQAARRFARAQIANIHARMESLHRMRAGSGLALTPPRGFAAPGTANRPSLLLANAPTGFEPPARRASDAVLLTERLASALVDVARSGSFNVSASNAPASGTTGLWAGGSIQLGTRDQTPDSSGLRFSTDGVSAGIDRRMSERLALGVSMGYARDETDIGNDGTRTRAKGASVAFYGSYQPTANTFVDGLIGYGTLDFDSDRYVAAANDFARGSRSGDHWFGSLAAGYESREGNVLLSPYGRLDFARARLEQYTESGAGLAALTYFEQRLPTLQFSFGVRAESIHETAFGWALPRLRLEYRHDFSGTREARLAYADLPAGPLYSVTPSADKRGSLVLGVGSDFLLRSGLRLGLDYQVQRLSGVNHSQAVRFWLSKELDGKPIAPLVLPTLLSHDPVRVEAALAWDDNVNRARDAGDKLADRTYALTAGKSTAIALGTNTRLVAEGFLAGDKFARYPGLDRFSAGGQAELQYRGSAAFDAATWGLVARVTFDEHAGQLRSGHRYSVGVTYRQSLTDRIDLFAAISANGRGAQHAAFDGRDTSARFNLDYALTGSGVVYFGGEHRRGDIVSTLPHSDAYESLAKAEVRDDAYGGEPRYAYRYAAKTRLWTLGYNLPLGPRDSLDFSLRRATSKPTATLNPIYGSASKYTANQYSIAYLMRF